MVKQSLSVYYFVIMPWITSALQKKWMKVFFPAIWRFTLLVFTALIHPPILYAQTTDPQLQWVPISTPQLSREEIEWLDVIINSQNEQMYNTAISYLKEQVYEGKVSSADRVTIQLITDMILEPYENNTNSGAIELVNRITAVNLLGYIGGEFSLDAADHILEVERDDTVLSELFAVYESIAPSFTDNRTAQFTRHLRKAVWVSENESLCTSILSAIESMHMKTWSMTSPILFEEILSISRSGMNNQVKRQATSLARLIAGAEIEPQ